MFSTVCPTASQSAPLSVTFLEVSGQFLFICPGFPHTKHFAGPEAKCDEDNFLPSCKLTNGLPDGINIITLEMMSLHGGHCLFSCTLQAS